MFTKACCVLSARKLFTNTVGNNPTLWLRFKLTRTIGKGHMLWAIIKTLPN